MPGNGVPADIRNWDQPTGSRAGVAPFSIGSGPAPPGAAVSRAPMQRVATLPPFWLEKPRSGNDVYFNETTILAAAAGATFTFGVGAIELPRSNVGVISYLTIFVDAPGVTLDVTWTILVNGGPVAGWDQIRSFPRVANNLSIVYPSTIHLPLGAIVTVQVTNQTAAGPWTVGAEVGGWHWPEIDERQAFGSLTY